MLALVSVATTATNSCCVPPLITRTTCVALAPAIDPGELRTALLVGEFGSAKDDPPATWPTPTAI